MMMRNPRVFVIGLALCLYLSTSLAYNKTGNACRQLSTWFKNATVLPSQRPYDALSTENWSQTTWERPSCIVQPGNTHALQDVVQLLTRSQIQFAIRSGGHSPSPFAASIDNGVLIDMSKFSGVDYDSNSNVATIGAGMKWGDVYHYLDSFNVTVVVLANGTLVNANQTWNDDLFWALKGGSNNFGIVTTFSVSTYAIHDIWGGVKLYTIDQLPALMAAMHAYQSAPDKDPYANIMMQASTTNASVGAVLNMVYLKPEITPPAFAPFYNIPTIGDLTKLQTLTEMMSGQMLPDLPRWTWRATSFTPTATTSLYQEIATILSTAPELSLLQSAIAGSLALGLQPISSSLIMEGNARGGGNPLGLVPVNQTWFVLDAGWLELEGDETVAKATKGLIDRIEEATRNQGSHLEYIFMNDASPDQDVIGHYREENVRRLKEVQARYDPDFVFQDLVRGGFKIPRA
ncbi:uncharacterized protein KY384_000049 [Bacidia gigantensis]|uniref:uncharacterized protein n=1 Tax=Bacidia gigantensis TaxID=2732470 RepID=UPI001D03FBD9|nr:uncharacterized protein KY384_000049 [Bacidia gigantensis]KAG8526456.1 hypothetical protein KY384_000049 [Bacidia gigantensis]